MAKLLWKARRQLCVALILTQFREDFGPTTLRPFLLWNGVVCACQACGYTILARVGTFTYTFDFSSMTATGMSVLPYVVTAAYTPIASSLHGSNGAGSGGHGDVAS